MNTALRQGWEAYWDEIAKAGETALWDSPSATAAAIHLRRVEQHIDPALPMIDLGCGSGRQTVRLAESCNRVIGIDIAEHALAIARRDNAAANIEYRRIDLLDDTEVAALAAELGDANVYVRGVLHQLLPDAQQRAVWAIGALLAGRGHLIAHELTSVTRWVVRSIIESEGAALEKFEPLQRHFGFDIPTVPGEERQLDALLTRQGLQVVASGDDSLQTTQLGADGAAIELPTAWALARRPHVVHPR
ncbi:class I SAM-dependent methyltransferase [Amycolatopsis speibonae]|uniref:Class I SAM-dependent methyltransferase n=1 Tax=Amycolatopsis speibonae TaxID=1450224 RepID=A0ABV7P3N2_9PSEU